MNEKESFNEDLTDPGFDLTRSYRIPEVEESESKAEHPLEELIDIDQANTLIKGMVLEHRGLNLKNAHFEHDWSIIGEDEDGNRILVPEKDAGEFLRSLLEK